MNHTEAQRHLSDLLAGELSEARRAELAAHLDECEECRGWSETYGFLSQALQDDHQAEHPSSEQIARLAVDAELLTAQESERLADHLEHCADCRRELKLSREALAGAAGGATVARFRQRPPAKSTGWRLALAASLILALALTLLVARPGGVTRGPVTAGAAKETGRPAAGETAHLATEAPRRPAIEEAARPATEAVPAAGGEALAELLSEVPTPSGAVAATPIPGPEPTAPPVVTADYPIESGAVTLRAEEMVVLTNGFSIDPSASLGVQVAPRSSSGP